MRFLRMLTLGLLGAELLVAKPLQLVEEKEHRQMRRFCSPVSKKQALGQCQRWLASQGKQLGDRLLTGHCSQAAPEQQFKVCTHRSYGELRYVLRVFRYEDEGEK